MKNIILASLIIILASFFLPWSKINWGKFENLPGRTITVVGQASSQEKNQVATFTAGVNVVDDDKTKAIEEVNGKIQKLNTAVKDFGITSNNLKTVGMNIYQEEETYYEDNKQKSRPGQWRVSNSLEIRVSDVSQSEDLARILTESGANNVYGPNYSLEDTKEAEMKLLESAIENAKLKAGEISRISKVKLGKILSVNEAGNAQTPIYQNLGYGGGGGGFEAGTEKVNKAVIVVFEVK